MIMANCGTDTSVFLQRNATTTIQLARKKRSILEAESIRAIEYLEQQITFLKTLQQYLDRLRMSRGQLKNMVEIRKNKVLELQRNMECLPTFLSKHNKKISPGKTNSQILELDMFDSKHSIAKSLLRIMNDRILILEQQNMTSEDDFIRCIQSAESAGVYLSIVQENYAMYEEELAVLQYSCEMERSQILDVQLSKDALYENMKSEELQCKQLSSILGAVTTKLRDKEMMLRNITEMCAEEQQTRQIGLNALRQDHEQLKQSMRGDGPSCCEDETLATKEDCMDLTFRALKERTNLGKLEYRELTLLLKQDADIIKLHNNTKQSHHNRLGWLKRQYIQNTSKLQQMEAHKLVLEKEKKEKLKNNKKLLELLTKRELSLKEQLVDLREIKEKSTEELQQQKHIFQAKQDNYSIKQSEINGKKKYLDSINKKLENMIIDNCKAEQQMSVALKKLSKALKEMEGLSMEKEDKLAHSIELQYSITQVKTINQKIEAQLRSEEVGASNKLISLRALGYPKISLENIKEYTPIFQNKLECISLAHDKALQRLVSEEQLEQDSLKSHYQSKLAELKSKSDEIYQANELQRAVATKLSMNKLSIKDYLDSQNSKEKMRTHDITSITPKTNNASWNVQGLMLEDSSDLWDTSRTNTFTQSHDICNSMSLERSHNESLQKSHLLDRANSNTQAVTPMVPTNKNTVTRRSSKNWLGTQLQYTQSKYSGSLSSSEFPNSPKPSRTNSSQKVNVRPEIKKSVKKSHIKNKKSELSVKMNHSSSKHLPKKALEGINSKNIIAQTPKAHRSSKKSLVKSSVKIKRQISTGDWLEDDNFSFA